MNTWQCLLVALGFFVVTTWLAIGLGRFMKIDVEDPGLRAKRLMKKTRNPFKAPWNRG